MTTEKLILCMKWGTMYGPEYVNCLYGMVSRNISGSYKVVCFTDDKSGVRDEVTCFPLPELEIDLPSNDPGKHQKLALFNKDLFGLSGTALFLDLDVVILNSIDPYFEYANSKDVITARNWVKPLQKSAQTSVFRFKIGAHSYLVEKLQSDPSLLGAYQLDQDLVSNEVHGGVSFWPEPWTKHFRLHCMGPWPMRYIRAPKKPKGARIITFPGSPNPSDAMRGVWNAKLEHRTPLEQLKWVNEQRKAGRKWRKYLSRYVQPTPWIAEAWHE